LSLDLSKIVGQLAEMVKALNSGNLQKRERLQNALDIIGKETDPHKLKTRIEKSKTSFLIASPTEDLSNSYQPIPVPDDFTVLATDGSQIDTDRHQAARYYLINIGGVRLDYGDNPSAELNNNPRLYFEDEDLVMTAPDNNLNTRMVEGTLLGLKRDVEECARLADMVEKAEADKPVLALLDGSLIKWSLESKDLGDFIIDELLVKGFLKSLERMRKKQQDETRELALASYISSTGSRDVINTLKIIICPYTPVNCDKHCKQVKPGERPCDLVDSVLDRDIFHQLLDEGERSALFRNTSKIVKDYYSENRIFFFYVKIDGEIARIEIPLWVAESKRLIELIHTLVLDQCRRGHGYPVALSEAHEQAVVTSADKQLLDHLLEESLNREKIASRVSAKSRSKRTRWL